MKTSFTLRLAATFAIALVCTAGTTRAEAAGESSPRASNGASDGDRIRPWKANPRYWQYQGRPVLLLGGSKDDSLFQIPDLKEHLDLLAQVGGNYIRNTMSARSDHGFEVHPFQRLADGKYDLTRFSDEYWKRFQNLLDWTRRREIIVQIEVWDRFDYTDADGMNCWQASPYNPANNVNYTCEETGLAERYPAPPYRDKHHFFFTIPGMKQYRKQYDLLRKFQEGFVSEMLSHTLSYPNVLYCMDNETSTAPRWGQYWMQFIREKAAQRGVDVYLTDMFDDGWKPERSAKLRQAFDHPELYPFIEISQINSRNFGQDHWDRLQWVMSQMVSHPRPVNNVKIYGDGNTRWGSGLPPDGVERFWRDLLSGCASARFHRDGGGTGLKPISQASIKAVRKVESLVKFWDIQPHNELLSDRAENEAYLAAQPAEAYVLYFTDGGSVGLDLSGAPQSLQLKWVNVASGDWGARDTLAGGKSAIITAPGKGGQVAVITRR